MNILYDAQVTFRKKTLICVNSLLHLSTDYFIEKSFTAPCELSTYQQQLLSVETRDDTDIKKLYQMTHQQYQYYGGIKSEIWLNLYKSLRSLQIDVVSSEDEHPGYLSQDVYAKYLINQFDLNQHNYNFKI